MILNVNPIPILFDNNNFVNSNDIEKIKKLNYNYLPELGNSFSADYSVLDNFPNIKQIFENKIKIYEEEIMGGITPAELYITQSWVSDTSKDGYHVKHTHNNSLFSAVLYISVPENGCVNFSFQDRFFEKFKFVLPHERETFYNRTMLTVPVKEGDFILFPSWLDHWVDNNKSDKHRIVIGANYFIRGVIGFDRYPTKIVL